MSLSFPSIWVPGSSFILASCLIGKEAISSILLDQCLGLIALEKLHLIETFFLYCYCKSNCPVLVCAVQ